MNPIKDSIKDHFMNSLILGVGRGVIVKTLVYPFEVIKINQQCHQNQENIYQVIKRLWQKEGSRAFYRGFFPDMIQNSVKQTWSWPMMTCLPYLLDQYHIHLLSQQAIIGISIATVDTLTNPLTRWKFLAISKQAQAISFREAWYGSKISWMSSSVGWSTFLVSQKYFRQQAYVSTGNQQLNMIQLMTISVKIAIVSSIATAPFDVFNTRKQMQKLDISTYLFSEKLLRMMFRGWPVRTFSLIINNIASIYLLDKLGQGNHK